MTMSHFDDPVIDQLGLLPSLAVVNSATMNRHTADMSLRSKRQWRWNGWVTW